MIGLKKMVIRAFCNHEGLTYPYGYRQKERFRLCGQLSEGQKVRILRFVQDKPDGSGIGQMPQQNVWKTEVPEAHQNGDFHCAGVLPATAGVSSLA